MFRRQQAGTATVARRIGTWRRRVTGPVLFAAALAAFPAHAAPAPIKLAVFDFEFEDVSAGAAYTGEGPSDRTDLMDATNEVRRLLAQSGRYRLVDVEKVDAAAAKTHTLRYCKGCDAVLARKLGAQQSFVGVVRRVSRVEYTVRFQIRDTRTGAVVSDVNSGLRMGANYSWGRGAVQLVKAQLLERQARN